MFRDLVPLQLTCLHKYTTLIPGTVEAMNAMKKEFGESDIPTTILPAPIIIPSAQKCRKT
ncbi:hypothetical protein DPMN_055522 [Dreissena polymorpha]|uniref:Uncharacterized protein n=1 Tax=Dreissena polymorpha TaxID=45954 RepID=A0A9D4HSP3_DREPO|nr:hypothetical protein DPMN_055522 [Dreissena polymorpha]